VCQLPAGNTWLDTLWRQRATQNRLLIIISGMLLCCKNFPVLLWGPFFVGPLFGWTCWTCLNPPLSCQSIAISLLMLRLLSMAQSSKCVCMTSWAELYRPMVYPMAAFDFIVSWCAYICVVLRALRVAWNERREHFFRDRDILPSAKTQDEPRH